MKRIDTSTKAVDLFGAGKHGFKDGNKSLGIAATDLDASIFNNVQEEICRVIEAAGIALDGAVYNQLLLALRAAGVFTTPAQFDNTTKAATTAFVQGALGNLAGFGSLNASATLTLAQLGMHIQMAQATASGQTITLPPIAGLPSGVGYWITNDSANSVTIKANGAENINPIGNYFSLLAKESVFVFVQGATQWNIFGAVSALLFQSSLGATNGYQKLPSGVIFQWGKVTSTGVATNTINLNMTFPNSFNAIFCLDAGSARINYGATPISNSQFTEYGSAAGNSFFWFAIGW